MASLFENSNESIHTGLDIFSLPPTQTAVEEGQFVEIFPLAALSDNAPIDFYITGSNGEYLDLNNTFLHLKAKIVKPDGAPLDADAEVAPVNNWLHSLFSQVDVVLNDTVISSSENTYAYRSYLETLLNFGRSAKETHLTAALFYKDTSGYFAETQGDANIGRLTRRGLTATSRTVDLFGRLHSEIFQQERCIPSGVNIKIKLTPSKSSFNIIAHPNDAFRSVITHASMYVRRLKLSPPVALALEKTWLRTTAKYPMKRVTIKTFSVPQGLRAYTQDNMFLNQTPTRVVIGLVRSSAFNGHQRQNPFNFAHYNLSFLNLTVDGRQIAGKPLTPDFERNNYARAYFGSQLGLGLANRDIGNDLSYADYCGGHTLYVFDLTPSLIDGDVFELIKSAAMALEIKFSEELPHPINVLVYGELDSVLELDRNRQVLLDF